TRRHSWTFRLTVAGRSVRPLGASHTLRPARTSSGKWGTSSENQARAPPSVSRFTHSRPGLAHPQCRDLVATRTIQERAWHKHGHDGTSYTPVRRTVARPRATFGTDRCGFWRYTDMRAGSAGRLLSAVVA